MAIAPKFEDVVVTPAKAKEWLDTNESNRNVSRKVVEAYARDMTNGRWKYTGDPIRFDQDGNLIDGQHRLEAVIVSGQKQKFHVVHGILRDHRRVIDTGRKRSVADNAFMDYGVKNAPQVTAAARVILRWRNGTLRQTSQMKLSEAEVYDFVIENDATLQEAASYAQKLRRIITITGASATAAYHETRLVDAIAAEEFWDKVLSGVELKVGDPALAFRNAIARLGTKHEDRSLLSLELAARAWRTYLKGNATGGRLVIKTLRQIKEADFNIRLIGDNGDNSEE